MTSRQARTARREAERKAAKLARKAAITSQALPGFVSQKDASPSAPLPPSTPEPSLRAQINRANASHSCGPVTPQGKLASSRNSLKHGLASRRLIMPGEDPAAFDSLLESLFNDHQPANATEELLIQEMAQSYWLMQRALRLQNECFTDPGIDEKRLALFLRYHTTHERAFHKSLAALLRLQKERRRPVSGQHSGFVSQKPPATASQNGFVSQNAVSIPAAGPQNIRSSAP